MILAFTSLLVSHWAAYNKPTANFFLLPTRGWELAIGSGIALYFHYKSKKIFDKSPYLFRDELLSALGLFLIGYSIFVFNDATPFPGLYALVPTIGTGLIIVFSSRDTIVGKLLSSRSLVFIGLISYSSYLWHQPIFAFARHRSLSEPTEILFMLLILLTFILAFLSWKFVERPFRAKGQLSRKIVVIFAFTGTALFTVIGSVGHISDGFKDLPNKNHITEQEIETQLQRNTGLSPMCDEEFTLSKSCRTSESPEILVWGDSYAMHLVNGILASNSEARIIQFTKSVCGPFFDVAPVTSKYSVKWARECLDFTDSTRKWIKKNRTVKYVVISSPFYLYWDKDNKLLTRQGSLVKADISSALRYFRETLDELASYGITPVIFSPPPTNGVDLGRCLVKADWYAMNLDKCNFSTSDIIQYRKDTIYFLGELNPKYRVIRLDKLICDDNLCRSHINDVGLLMMLVCFGMMGTYQYQGQKFLGTKTIFIN